MRDYAAARTLRLTVRCPTCGMPPGTRCVDRRAWYLLLGHRERLIAAKAAARDEGGKP